LVHHVKHNYRASEWRACALLLTVRGSRSYQKHARAWADLRMRIREIALMRLRYRFRKVRVLLNPEGWNVGRDLVYRLYKGNSLGLKIRPRPEENAAGPRITVRGRSAQSGLEPRLRT
jgi:putative transposase